MKRILIFSLAYYPQYVSGAEAAVREITDRIAPSDIEFYMITLKWSGRDQQFERIGNVFVHRIGFGPSYVAKILFVPLAVLKGVLLHRKYRFAALWTVMTYMLFPVVLAKAFGVRVPHVVTLQDGDPYKKVFGRWFILPFRWILDRGFKTASAVQAISHYLAAWPATRGYKGKVEVIGNGADPRDVDGPVSETDVAALKERLGKRPGDIFLVNTARLVHQKGHDTVIRALTLLPNECRFLLVGGGPLRHELERLARELHVADRVIFVGQVDRMAVTDYRRAADIFVAPSRSEGLGNAFLSAMASKLPVIATQEGGLAEFIFDAAHNPDREPTAWVVKKDDPKSVASAVLAVLSDPDRVRSVTERARAMVLKEFNWDTIALEMQKTIFARAFAASPDTAGKV